MITPAWAFTIQAEKARPAQGGRCANFNSINLLCDEFNFKQEAIEMKW
jgi:hypothetical protein